MRQKNAFTVYPDSPAAPHLSMAAGGVRLLSWIVCVLAVAATLAVLLPAFQLFSMAGFGRGLYLLLDETDDALFLAFGLWCVFAALRYASAVLRTKIALLTQKQDQAP